MIRRPRRTVPAAVVALVVLVAAVLVAVSCIQTITGNTPLVAFGTLGAGLADVSWRDPAVLAAGAVAVLLGVVLLAAALLPGTPRVLALNGGNPLTTAGIARTGLARDLTAHARSADGITTATARVSARRVSVVARTPLRDRSGLLEQVRDAVDARLDDINLAHRPRVRVTLATDRSAR